MSSVVELSSIKPKIEECIFKNQKYILRYDPNASVSQRWTYKIKFTRTYEFSGAAPTIGEAHREAKRQITQLTARSAS